MTDPDVGLIPGMRRPHTAADLAEVPPGWRAGPPDFVAAGCGRAGSTWWWRLIQQHPAVVPSRLGNKEIHFFQHFGWNGPDAAAVDLYRRAFAAPPGAICGDGSFNYLSHPLAIAHLWDAAPSARLLVLVRNPIDRFVSTVDRFSRHRMAWLGLTGERAYVQRTYSFWAEAAMHCRIADGVRAVTSRWAPENVLVLQFERCVSDPAGEIARTYRFLGVDDGFVPRGLDVPVNQEVHAVPPPDAAARRRLAEFFEADVEYLAGAWPDLDLRLWPDFG